MVAPAALGDGVIVEPLPGDGGVNTGLLALGNTYRQSGSGGSGGSGSRGQGQHRKPPAPKVATASQRARLLFTPVSAVIAAGEQVAVQQLVQNLQDLGGNTVDPTTVQQAYDQDVNSWDAALAQEPGHWRLNNLGDDAAFALLEAYDAYKSRGTPDAGDQVIRREVQNALAIHPAVRRLARCQAAGGRCAAVRRDL